MADYKIQLKDKNGNRQYPVTVASAVIGSDGIDMETSLANLKGGLYFLKYLEYPHTSGLSEEDKANNIQIYNAIKNGTLDRSIATYKDGIYTFFSCAMDDGTGSVILTHDVYMPLEIEEGTPVNKVLLYTSIELKENGEAFVTSMGIETGDEGITEETDPIFSASPAANITNSDISNWNKAEANVQSDWNVTDSSSDAFIKNKPTIPAAVTESTVSGWGFTKNTGTYSKPSTGIPKSDLASSVQTSLGKADTALQSYTEQYKGTVTGVKINGTTKNPSSGTVDIGNVVTGVKINGSSKSPSSGIVDLGTIPTTVDSSMSTTSTNPVQNKVVTSALNELSTRVDAVEDFFDEGAKLNLSIKSNQGTDSTISAVKATIQYDGKTIQSGSGVIGLPVFTDIKITFPTVAGYKTPEPLEFTTGGTPVVYSVTYETEVVNVILSAWDGASVVGQTVTINGTSYTWNGTTISHKVPYGVEYSVSANSKDGYTEPDEKFTASQPVRNVAAIYSAIVGSWITLNQTITDPSTMLSGNINGEHIQLIRNNSHRYLGKYTADGVMTICQLDDSNSNLYADGSTADLTGADGDVFMKLPKFYYSAKEKSKDVWDIGFYYGDSAPSLAWMEWDGTDLIGAYKCTMVNSKLYSRSGTTMRDETYNNINNAAAARGSGFSSMKWKYHCIMAFLFYAMYGNMNSQACLGNGWSTSKTGNTDILGMEDTVAGNEGAINFWGLESWWGGGTEVIGNVVYNPEIIDKSVHIIEDDGTERIITPPDIATNNFFMSRAMIGKHLDLFPSSSFTADGSSSNSATTGYCDQVYITMSSTARILTRSGHGSSESYGVAYISATNTYNTTYTGKSRLCFRGNLIVQNDSTIFKSLTTIS